jgi:hypothetical protein
MGDRMRKREAESIVDDILNELQYMSLFKEAFKKLEENYGTYNLRETLVKIVMDEE